MHPRLMIAFPLIAAALVLPSAARAHEHEHTHAALTAAAFELLIHDYPDAFEQDLQAGIQGPDSGVTIIGADNEEIAAWHPSGDVAANQPLPATSFATNVTASDLESNGLVGGNWTDAYVLDNWPAHVDPDRFLTFSVEPSDEGSVSFERLEITIYKGFSSVGHWELRVSTNDFSSPLKSTFVESGDLISVNLEEAVGSQTEAVTFRLYLSAGGLTPEEIRSELIQGVIDEDECTLVDDLGMNWSRKFDDKSQPFWNSHFYHVGSGDGATGGAPDAKLDLTSFALGVQCGISDLQIRNATNTTATRRASALWDCAVGIYENSDYSGALCPVFSDANESRKRAYRILGRILHLMEDMTSPAHTHNDPHGEVVFNRSDCGKDADDFENWGWCNSENTAPKGHIKDYLFLRDEEGPYEETCEFDFEGDGILEDYGRPPEEIRCRAWAALNKLFSGRPQGVIPDEGENMGFSYVKRVASVTYDFTKFQVVLGNPRLYRIEQANSALKRMFRGNSYRDCRLLPYRDGLCQAVDGWSIDGDHQSIGRTWGLRGNHENAVGDVLESWWVEDDEDYDREANHCFIEKSRLIFGGERCKVGARGPLVEGFAYIENAGGDKIKGSGPGPLGGNSGPFIPLRYEKTLYSTLYGSSVNEHRYFYFGNEVELTHMLRIYGDVLYPVAIAYGAGLIDAFAADVDDRPRITGRPIADAGGPYVVIPCLSVAIELDASKSVPGELGVPIIRYEWDLDNDGAFDGVADAVSEEDPTISVFVEAESIRQIRLRVTDASGNRSEATATLEPSAPEGAILGTEASDIILGTTGDDIIIGYGGDDVIFGRGGNDLLIGCEGNDWLSGGDGSDHLSGGSGDDRVLGGNDDDVLEAGSAGKRGDRLDGGSGTDECSEARRIRKCESAL